MLKEKLRGCIPINHPLHLVPNHGASRLIIFKYLTCVFISLTSYWICSLKGSTSTLCRTSVGEFLSWSSFTSSVSSNHLAPSLKKIGGENNGQLPPRKPSQSPTGGHQIPHPCYNSLTISILDNLGIQLERRMGLILAINTNEHTCGYREMIITNNAQIHMNWAVLDRWEGGAWELA